MLLPWVIGMLVVAAAQWAWFRWGAAEHPAPPRRGARAIPAVLAVLSIVVAAGSVGMVALIGDSGARAVWGGVVGAGG